MNLNLKPLEGKSDSDCLTVGMFREMVKSQPTEVEMPKRLFPVSPNQNDVKK
jgi:hypothetical protein